MELHFSFCKMLVAVGVNVKKWYSMRLWTIEILRFSQVTESSWVLKRKDRHSRLKGTWQKMKTGNLSCFFRAGRSAVQEPYVLITNVHISLWLWLHPTERERKTWDVKLRLAFVFTDERPADFILHVSGERRLCFLVISTLLEWPVAHRYLMCGFLAQCIFRSAILSIKPGSWGVILRFQCFYFMFLFFSLHHCVTNRNGIFTFGCTRGCALGIEWYPLGKCSPELYLLDPGVLFGKCS